MRNILLVLCVLSAYLSYAEDFSPTPESQADLVQSLSDEDSTHIKHRKDSGEKEGSVPEMVSVPAGWFEMGRSYEWDPLWGEEKTDELPVHDVFLDEYQIGKYQTTNQEFAEVLNWALAQGYLTDSVGGNYVGGLIYAYGQLVADTVSSSSYSQITYTDGVFGVRSRTGYNNQSFSMAQHPVLRVCWYGMVCYCNWLSEQQGLQPCYDPSNWKRYEPLRNGYRLPTEAEWERAAAWDGNRQWHYGMSSDSIDFSRANFRDSVGGANPLELINSPYTAPVGWYNGINPVKLSVPGTLTVNAVSPVGAYDMCGNAWDLCHDWYSATYYSGDPIINPTGPLTGDSRVGRGGAWGRSANECMSAFRGASVPDYRNQYRGFRVARTERRELTLLLPGDIPLELVWIPAGTFMMGRYPGEPNSLSNEDPQHEVTLTDGFWLGKYEITQQQWLAVMGSWPVVPPDVTAGLGNNYPAYNISWQDAKQFITSLNMHVVTSGQGPLTTRLPSEAEWEYACRAGTQTRFYFGDSLDCDRLCEDCAAGVLSGNRSDYMWYCGNNTPEGTKAVGGKIPNACGLYDMSGNLYEWCEDDYHSNYIGAPVDGSAWINSPRAGYRILRGGRWNWVAQYCRSSRRNGNGTPTDFSTSTGFRLAADQMGPIEGEGEAEGETPAEGESPTEGEEPAEGEGEITAEGEGEVPVEGEGEAPFEGEGEMLSEGEIQPEGEGEGEGESEGEDEACGCCSSSGKILTPKDLFERTLGDWLVIGMTLMALTALSFSIKK